MHAAAMGARTSLRYSGTSALLAPIPMPVRKRPIIIGSMLPDSPLMMGPICDARRRPRVRVGVSRETTHDGQVVRTLMELGAKAQAAVRRGTLWVRGGG